MNIETLKDRFSAAMTRTTETLAMSDKKPNQEQDLKRLCELLDRAADKLDLASECVRYWGQQADKLKQEKFELMKDVEEFARASDKLRQDIDEYRI